MTFWYWTGAVVALVLLVYLALALLTPERFQ